MSEKIVAPKANITRKSLNIPSDVKEELKIVISKFSPVFLSNWKGEQESCAICKSDFAQPCNHCSAEEIEEPCPTQTGKCGHSFHLHCIQRWLKEHKTCPLCMNVWEIK